MPICSLRNLRSSHIPILLHGFCVFFSALVLLALGVGACKSANHSKKPETLVLIDQGWLSQEYREWHRREMEGFKSETGISVELFPAPETAVDQLALWKRLLETHSSTPDVYAVDVIWPKLLYKHLVDLRPYYPAEDLADFFPTLLSADTVEGKLIAIPNRVGSGLLFYRTDLLERYGYKHPPETWEELQTMAARIQAGERARGDKNFWGYIWQGAPTEALTCNALEWQASEGGGTIVENNKTISVNNPDTIRAWKRAAEWVGTISPPAVVAYKEWDAMNLWEAGHAAFMRNWTAAYVTSRDSSQGIRDKFNVTYLPAGKMGHTAALGGLGYAVSRYTQYPQDAIALNRFLVRKDTLEKQSETIGEPPPRRSLYQNQELLKKYPFWNLFTDEYVGGLVRRPAIITGEKYADVSKAYFEAVHSVLADGKDAAQAAADLEKQLMEITGFPKGEPEPLPMLKERAAK